MESFAALVGIAVVLFAWTNVDDLLVLLGFFSDPKFRPRHVVIGQSLGITVLYGVSVLASLLSIVVPPAYIGLLGLAPIVLGVAKLYSLRGGVEPGNDERDDHAIGTARAGRNIFSVAMATVANGGDNISVYTPLFATRSAVEVAVVGVVFAIMTALWCFLGHWLVHHPALGAPLRRYGHITLPFILIGFGILILYEAGTLKLLGSYLGLPLLDTLAVL
jgi:cadmium resistance protein CadD (predicted permease)